MKCDKCGYSDNGSGDWAHVCGTVNIKSGADIHAGDGGYSLGTQEKYDEFVKGRNQSLDKTRIKKLSLQSANDIADLFNPDFFDDRMVYDVAQINKKFAELIVRECANMAESFHHHQYDFTGNLELHEFIKAHFGVEE
jgi:hypothetical protein